MSSPLLGTAISTRVLPDSGTPSAIDAIAPQMLAPSINCSTALADHPTCNANPTEKQNGQAGSAELI
jgi:hypothetical protein